MKTLALDEEFTLLFPLKAADTSTVLQELKEHNYNCSIAMNGHVQHPVLSVTLGDFAHAQLFVDLVLSIITDHNDILEYIRELRD